MEEEKNSLQIFEPNCLNVNEIRPITENVTFPDSVFSIDTASTINVAENDSAFIETSDCSEVSAIALKSSETFSDILFSNDTVSHINEDECGRFLKADSGIAESESIVDETSKLIGFHSIEQSLSENSGNMTFDFNLKENSGQFDDNEFHSSVDFFNDPSFLNFLESASSSTAPANTLHFRDSLYRKFDPLYVNYFSESSNISNKKLKVDKDKIDNQTEKFPDTCTFNNVQNEVQCNESLRQSIGNMLISFETPIIDKRKNSLSEYVGVCDSEKLYTEEELQKALEIQEFAIRGTFLRKQKELEELFLRKMEEFETKFDKQKCLSNSLCIILKEAMNLVNVFSDKKKMLEIKLTKAEKDKNNLKEDLDTFVSDLQNIEHSFSDFHKQFEENTTILKLYIRNENLMKQLENMNVQLHDKEKIYKEFQSRSQEIIDKFDIDITSRMKSGEA